MSEVADYTISLRFFGDDLDPDVLSSLLGAQPSTSCRKGDVFHGKVSDRIEKTGKWLLKLPSKPGEPFELRIETLLSGLTQDLTVWRELAEKYNADVFCGVWLGSSNEGMELPPRLMTQLAERGLHLGLDIYAPDEDDDG